ncbi:MAG: SLC13 family permease [Chloroflexi bacterium]|nr:SLC13 family permease [Chloroflexota bacterium]
MAYFVLVVLLGTALILALDRWPVDVVALGVLILLVVTRVLTVEEGLAGFSAPVTIIVATTYMLGAGLRRSGAAAAISDLLVRIAGPNEVRLIVSLVLLSGFLSAFMSNLAVFALMLPATLTLVERYNLRPGRVLLPMAIGCNVGGLLTLLGSTPNLAASDMLAQAGYEPLHMFSFTPIALPALLVTAGYLALFGSRFLPTGEVHTRVQPSLKEIAREYGLERGLYTLRVRRHSSLIGRPLHELNLREAYNVSILEVLRGDTRFSPPTPDLTLEPGDILVVEGKPGAVAQLAAQHDLEMLGRVSLERVAQQLPEGVVFAEVLIPPRSPLIGRTPVEVGLRTRFGIHAVALLREGEVITEGVRTTRLRVGDSLLVQGTRAGLRRAVDEGWLIVAHYLEPEPGAEPTPKLWIATGIMVGMVLLAGTGVLSLVTSSLLALLLMVITGCLKPYEMYRVVHWRTVIMIAALLPLGTAMAKSGAAELLGEGLSQLFGPWGGWALLSGIFFLAVGLTQVLSNTAVTVLLTPVALHLAQGHGLSPHILALAVVFGSSSSFLTPLTDALNVMIRETGRYRFRDFLLASAPAVLTFWLLLLLLGGR